MSCEQTTTAILHQHGLRHTQQRETIVAALRHTDGHRTAQAILHEVQDQHPTLHASTVYRTLTLFKRLGLVSETDLGSSELTYAWLGDERHHHLVCHHCKGVIELDHRYLETLATAIERDLGFVPTVDHFAIFGLCQTCRPAQ